jgi:hypothetical protein
MGWHHGGVLIFNLFNLTEDSAVRDGGLPPRGTALEWGYRGAEIVQNINHI